MGELLACLQKLHELCIQVAYNKKVTISYENIIYSISTEYNYNHGPGYAEMWFVEVRLFRMDVELLAYSSDECAVHIEWHTDGCRYAYVDVDGESLSLKPTSAITGNRVCAGYYRIHVLLP